MNAKVEWFSASKDGLDKIARRRGLGYVLFELVQNAWDTGAKMISVRLDPVAGRPLVNLFVEDDDPDGFKDLSHAYTLFAESEKKANPEKRGRFNLGEKLVLAVCDHAQIASTTGTVIFDNDGRRTTRARIDAGTEFFGCVRMTREEFRTVIDAAKQLIVPEGVTTVISWGGDDPGQITLERRQSTAKFECALPIEIADADGFLRRSERRTYVTVYEPLPGQPGRIYEMGIPVCETDDPWDLDVAQKVPVNLERNSVAPGYLRALRVHVVNSTFGSITPAQVASAAVQEAISDKRIDSDALNTVLTVQFGAKRAVADPSDREAENRLKAEGYTIIPSRALHPDTFANIREMGVARPAGKLSPSYKPYSTDPDAEPAVFINEADWTPAMKNVADYAADLGWRLIKKSIRVRFEKSRMTSPWAANYGGGQLTFNYARLGKSYFNEGVTTSLNDLLIHEYAHEYGDHLTAEFDKAMSRIGAALWDLAMREPEFFRKYTVS